jgi:hypothetical protein
MVDFSFFSLLLLFFTLSCLKHLSTQESRQGMEHPPQAGGNEDFPVGKRVAGMDVDAKFLMLSVAVTKADKGKSGAERRPSLYMSNYLNDKVLR